MTEDQDLERRRLAYRRAGLAVAHYTQGRPLSALSLRRPPGPGDEGPGHGRPVDLGSGARHRLELEVLAHWASLLCEARACLDDQEPAGGWGAAREPIADLGRRVTRSEEENEAYLEWLRRRALGLIDLPGTWPAVEAVAGALLAEGEIGGREATDLIAGVQRTRRHRSGIGDWFRGSR
ncbi:MAG: hypothetical protein ABIJ48_05500 [Actinomycetota bacterium]